MSATHRGDVFDAAATLGIGTPSSEPLPASEAGVIIIRVPEGLSFQALRSSAIGQQLMWTWNCFDRYDWSHDALPAGTYRLRIPVLCSNRKADAEQAATLPAGEQFAPVALAASALLCIRLQRGVDPLNGDWIRCAEQSGDGFRLAMTWINGRVHVCYRREGNRYGDVWASSVLPST